MVFSVKFLRAVVFVETSLLWEIYSPTCFSFYNCFIFKNKRKKKEKNHRAFEVSRSCPWNTSVTSKFFQIFKNSANLTKSNKYQKEGGSKGLYKNNPI